MVFYALTILLSSFFLFQIQPLIGKYILPWFGGTPAVWTTCMLFFQIFLLAGYAYAHLISSRLPVKTQAKVHLGMLLSSLLFLPIAPSAEVWRPSPEQAPGLQIMLLLAANIGMPYLLLSSTAPLIQRWFSVTFPGRSAYRLYALSNASSLLALLSYPFVFEPLLRLETQIGMWSAGYAVYAILAGCSAVKILLLSKSDNGSSALTPPAISVAGGSGQGTDPLPRLPSLATMTLWVGLAAFGSIMLLATTNQICQEIAVVPFLWVLPLSLYLLTFIISFDNEKWYDRRVFGPLLVLAMVLAIILMRHGGQTRISVQILSLSLILFACCMTIHGELVRAKPNPHYLTLFYLLVATGGAFGGLFVTLWAPNFFSGHWEYHIALAGCFLLTIVVWFRDPKWNSHFRRPRLLAITLGAFQVVLIWALATYIEVVENKAIFANRNFFGVIHVREGHDVNGPYRSLQHGQTLHGFQYLEEEKRGWPTSYYGSESGVGLALRHHPRRFHKNESERNLRVGVVGLGTGTIAAYGKGGDYFRFYEINPEVITASRRYFKYLADSKAAIDIVLGDARSMMEQELAKAERQNFDVLIVDAFSSDSIPIHLITKEAVDVYREHLKTDGLLLMHISNHFVNLKPVVLGLAEYLEWHALRVNSVANPKTSTSKAEWVILTKNESIIKNKGVVAAVQPWSIKNTPPIFWTDDFASLWQVVKF